MLNQLLLDPEFSGECHSDVLKSISSFEGRLLQGTEPYLKLLKENRLTESFDDRLLVAEKVLHSMEEIVEIFLYFTKKKTRLFVAFSSGKSLVFDYDPKLSVIGKCVYEVDYTYRIVNKIVSRSKYRSPRVMKLHAA